MGRYCNAVMTGYPDEWNVAFDLELVGSKSTCAADMGAWSGTTTTQDAGLAFAINDVVIDDAAIDALCDEPNPIWPRMPCGVAPSRHALSASHHFCFVAGMTG